MAGRPPVSCLIYTLNEQVNLPYCLASLGWCDDLVIVDSFSSDGTQALARAAGARFVQHSFTGFGDQRNWSLEHVPLRHPWALILDADECVPPELATELAERLPGVPDEVAAFRVRRRFHLWGKWLRYSSLYPTWVIRLVRVNQVRYVNRGHAETQVVDGRIDSLEHDLLDENHKGLEDWWARQNLYSTQEARYELDQKAGSWWDLFARDPLRRRAALKSLAWRLPGRPCWYFLYVYFLRRGFLDGAAGLRFCAMKAAYQLMITTKKQEMHSASGLATPAPGQRLHAPAGTETGFCDPAVN
jgi:glycosyltransferase involved in cell wall biosynthesis